MRKLILTAFILFLLLVGTVSNAAEVTVSISNAGNEKTGRIIILLKEA